MRLLLATSQFSPEAGGVPRLLWQYCANRPADFELAVMSVQQQTPDTYTEFDRKAPFPIRRVPTSQKKGVTSLRFGFELIRMIHQWHPDVILSGVAYPTAIIAAALAPLHTTPLVIFAHSEDVTIPGRLKRALLRFALRRAKTICTPSHFTRQALLGLGVDQHKTLVIYPGVELQSPVQRAARPWLEKLGNRWVLLTVARLVRRKGQDTVIRALPQLADKLPDIHYLIVGDGPAAEELIALACELGVRERVTFAGCVEDVDLPACYQACQAFVMPTRPGDAGSDGAEQHEVEGFGIVFLEAAASGKPVIGSLAGGAAEAVVHGETGYLIEPLDLDALVKDVLMLACDPPLAQQLGQAGLRRIQAGFTVDSFAQKLSAVIREAGRS
jgi:phosphatidyl-myo-inositol dimannoside synthase